MLSKKKSFLLSKRRLLLVFGLLVLGLLSFAPPKIHDPFSAQKKFCTLDNGMRLAYVEFGNPKGRPVILLHGYTDTGRSFERVAEHLLDRDRKLRIIIPDLRGHGASSMPTDSICSISPKDCFQITDFGGDVVRLMAHLRVDKAHIAGHSMGSMVAQHLAIFHPEKVEGITLIATVAVGGSSPVLQEFILGELIDKKFRLAAESFGLAWPRDAYRIAPEALGEHVADYLISNWVTESVADSSLLKAIGKETVRVNLGTWVGTALGIQEFDYRKELEKLQVPTLILSAVQDPVPHQVPDETDLFPALDAACRSKNTVICHKLYGRDGNAHSERLDLGHNFLWAVPEYVAADILSFMNSNAPQQNHTYLNEDGAVVTESSTRNILKWPRVRP